ncbi:leucine-rich repeat domain-containing protein, partial [Chloroflexota bacterium]
IKRIVLSIIFIYLSSTLCGCMDTPPSFSITPNPAVLNQPTRFYVYYPVSATLLDITIKDANGAIIQSYSDSPTSKPLPKYKNEKWAWTETFKSGVPGNWTIQFRYYDDKDFLQSITKSFTVITELNVYDTFYAVIMEVPVINYDSNSPSPVINTALNEALTYLPKEVASNIGGTLLKNIFGWGLAFLTADELKTVGWPVEIEAGLIYDGEISITVTAEQGKPVYLVFDLNTGDLVQEEISIDIIHLTSPTPRSTYYVKAPTELEGYFAGNYRIIWKEPLLLDPGYHSIRISYGRDHKEVNLEVKEGYSGTPRSANEKTLPDLIVNSFNIHNFTTSPGGFIPYSMTVKNIGGEGPIGDSDFYLSTTYLSKDQNLDATDIELGEARLLNVHIDIGWSYYIRDYALIPESISSGKYYLIVVTDGQPKISYSLSGVKESNENNNSSVCSSPISIEISIDKPKSEIVKFADANLEKVIREKIRNFSGDIYKSDLQQIQELEAPNRNIHNLLGIEYCTNISYLNLVSNQIFDLTPISPLVSLQELYISSNQITDISPLRSLSNLVNLQFHHNPVNDISPLESLTKLEVLEASVIETGNILPLRDLRNLRSISLVGNDIIDISPLASLKNLGQAILAFNKITDISPLSELDNLSYIHLQDNQINDIYPLTTKEYLIEVCETKLINLQSNPLSENSINTYIPQLKSRGISIIYP